MLYRKSVWSLPFALLLLTGALAAQSFTPPSLPIARDSTALNGLFRRGGSVSTVAVEGLASAEAAPAEAAPVDQAAVDRMLDNVMSRSKTQTVMIQFKVNSGRLFLLNKWKGTILEKTWKGAAMFTILNVIICVKAHFLFNDLKGWAKQMELLDKLWHMQMSLTTFILAFFLNKAQSVWADCLGYGRRIQGRLNDISILCSTHAKRDATGKILPGTQSILDDVARYERLFGIVFYSTIAKSHKILQTPEALLGMHARRLITTDELQVLQSISPGARHHAVIQWLCTAVLSGVEKDAFREGANLVYFVCTAITQLRATYGSVPDRIDDRINLAYAHFVQLLVDSFLIITPFAAFAEMGAFSPFATLVLTLFFQGLLDLSKMFLDPYDDSGDPIGVNALIQESNAGSTRFSDAAYQVPPAVA